MKKVIQLDATSVSFSQKIASSIKGLIGNIFEVNSKYMDIPNLKLFDRLNAIWSKTTSTAQIGVANFSLNPQGKGFIAIETAGTSQNFFLKDLNKDKFTFITVAKARSDGALTNLLMHDSALTPISADIVPRLQITTAGNFTFYTGTTSARISAPIVNPLAVHIYTLTFSVDEGLKLYIDGELAASNITDKRPLTNSVARFVAQINAGFGFVLSVDDDLSKIQHAAKLKLIHDTLKEQYAIT